jgi:hypothetical protein
MEKMALAVLALTHAIATALVSSAASWIGLPPSTARPYPG